MCRVCFERASWWCASGVQVCAGPPVLQQAAGWVYVAGCLCHAPASMCCFVHDMHRDNWQLCVWSLRKECNLAQADACAAVGPLPQQVGPEFGLCHGTLHVLSTFIIMLPSVTMVSVQQLSRLNGLMEQTGGADDQEDTGLHYCKEAGSNGACSSLCCPVPIQACQALSVVVLSSALSLLTTAQHCQNLTAKTTRAPEGCRMRQDTSGQPNWTA